MINSKRNHRNRIILNLQYYWAKILKKMRGCAIKNSHIPITSKIESGSHIVNSNFDRHSYCGYDCEITNADIGAFCSIANNVIIGGAMHQMEWVSMSPVFREGKDSVKTKFAEHKSPGIKRTTIGHDVWIGQRSLLKQGINIGNGAVIGMGSVVTKDVEPYSIVVGCPAKMIRKRFDDKIVKELLASEWWNLNDSELHKYAKFFNDPDLFIFKFKK